VTRTRARAVVDYLERRIAATLEWYHGCVVCEETTANMRKDLASLVEKTGRHFGIEMPFQLRLRVEDGIVTVSVLDPDAN
jgi:hypothetical protein